MRYIYQQLNEFASTKFVLLSGPRQVGKTTLAKAWLKTKEGIYLNWDILKYKKAILKQDFLKTRLPKALVLDELHKYGRWKGFLKGLYDGNHEELNVVVTGSARLDIFKPGQDSLLGRYEQLRLHPLSIGEITHGTLSPPPKDWLNSGGEVNFSLWEQLEKYSGFPEPFYAQQTTQHQRWMARRRGLILREEVQSIVQLRNLSLLEHLMILLPERVGSPLSINSLREDLQVAHDTLTNWIELLERVYYCFRVSPYHVRLSRTIKREQKLYFWDWTESESPGARFENMVASHLLKAVHAWNDVGYGEFSLMYFRNAEKEEVDFVVCNRRKPIALIECKVSDRVPAPALQKLSARLGDIPAIQLVNENIESTFGKNFLVASAARFLARLP